MRNPKSEIRNLTSYWDRTQWPLQSLFFLLPLLAVYEIGAVLAVQGGMTRQDLARIKAEALLDSFFGWFGVTSVYLPGLIVIVVLVCWHLVRRDPWRPEPKLYALMCVESLLLALPLLVFSAVLFREPASGGAAMEVANLLAGETSGGTSGGGGLANIPDWKTGMLLSIGAGIYEELLFRLIAIALLHAILVDLLALPDMWGAILAVLGSAVAFALYHFPGLGEIELGRFIFYTAAGVFFALVYVLRGFGIVVGTHALYDVLVISLLFAQQNN